MELNKKNVRTILLIIVFTVLLFTAVQNIGAILGFVVDVWGVFASIIAGLAIAFVLNVPLKLFEDKLFYALREHRNSTVRRLLRPVSIVCSLLITLGVLIVLLLIVLPQLVDAVAAVISRMPGYINDLIVWLDDLLAPLDFSVSAMLDGVDWNAAFNNISNTLSEGIDGIINTAGSALGTAANVGTTIINGAIDVIFSVIIAVYVLAQKERIGRFIRRCMSAFLPRRIALGIERICTMAAETFSNFISGQLTDSFILGLLCCIGMNIFRFPYANIIGVVVGGLKHRAVQGGVGDEKPPHRIAVDGLPFLDALQHILLDVRPVPAVLINHIGEAGAGGAFRGDALRGGGVLPIHRRHLLVVEGVRRRLRRGGAFRSGRGFLRRNRGGLPGGGGLFFRDGGGVPDSGAGFLRHPGGAPLPLDLGHGRPGGRSVPGAVPGAAGAEDQGGDEDGGKSFHDIPSHSSRVFFWRWRTI